MMVRDMKYVSKVVSKLYAVENGSNVVVAEVIENPGCGFDYLIRIIPEYKENVEVFNKCLDICNISVVGEIRRFIEESINRGYIIRHEEIAFIIDEII